MSENELEVPEDYTEEEKRSDVLSYSTGVLSHPLTVSGDFLVRLFVSCDCPDTDFVVRITDVDENGRSVKLGGRPSLRPLPERIRKAGIYGTGTGL